MKFKKYVFSLLFVMVVIFGFLVKNNVFAQLEFGSALSVDGATVNSFKIIDTKRDVEIDYKLSNQDGYVEYSSNSSWFTKILNHNQLGSNVKMLLLIHYEMPTGAIKVGDTPVFPVDLGLMFRDSNPLELFDN